MWVRLHTPPKQCRSLKLEALTCRQIYYFNASFARYSKTEDGQYINGLGSNLLPEIGRVESVRFIVSP